MAEQPSVSPDILELYPVLRQLGIDTTSRLMGQGLTLATRWSNTQPEQLPAEELQRVLKAHYLNVRMLIGDLEVLAERLSQCFTPTLEAYIAEHFEQEGFEGDLNY